MNKSKKRARTGVHGRETPAASSPRAARGAGAAKTLGRIRIPRMAVLLVALWAFCSLVYGVVFCQSRETSYFAWDGTLMHFLLQQDFGWLYAIGRLLLQSYRLPLFGGLVLSLILTACVWLIDYIIGVRGKWHALTAILPFAFLSYYVSLEYSINYHRETSTLMAWPFAALVLLSAAAAVKRFLVMRGKAKTAEKAGSRLTAVVNYGAIIAYFLVISGFCYFQRDNLIRLCRMQRMAERSEWDAMIDEALAARHPSRHIATYYAIALEQTGQLETRMFEIPMDFPDQKVTEMDGQKSDGTNIYTLDADFYAGLPNVSYHDCMETLVKNGPQLFLLKRMARAAAMNGEKALCRKYLTIIDRNPFEHAFVERYSRYASNPALMASEPEFRHVAERIPPSDLLEQSFRRPLFLGYNVALTEGRSLEALNSSLMALLYSKDLDGFMARVALIRDQQLPEYFQEAVLLQSLKIDGLLKEFPTINQQMIYGRLQSFVNAAEPYFRSQPTGQKKLRKDWQNYYPYYMYFDNLPPKKKKAEYKKQEGGVN